MLDRLARELRNLPLIRIIFPFIFGIIAGIRGNIYMSATLLALAGLSSCISFYFFFSAKKFKKRYYAGIFSSITFFLFGIIILAENQTEEFHVNGNEITAVARLTEPVEEKDKSFKTILEISSYQTTDSIWHASNHLIMTYFEKTDSVQNLNYGDYIFIKSRINPVENSGNPFEFDYRSFLHKRGITAQTYLKSSAWEKSTKSDATYIYKKAFDIRKYLISIYKEKGIDGQELAVLQALTLGEKSELDQDTRRSYVVSGAMHVLAVSGLHVGIIYMILGFLFGFLEKLKTPKFAYGKYLKAFIVIVLIWFFAMLSGLSPSVRRAAVMFTFFALGKLANRPISIYNSLAASAFLLLLINPFLITEVGFQLSYLAVTSIVYFQPKINGLFVIKNNFLAKIWELSSVSIAAQIGTTPISLFYFHIFPTWFLITNLFVIFLATFIVYGAAILLVTSFIPYVSDAVAYLLKKLVFIMNYLVESVEAMPYSAFDFVYFSEAHLFIFYALFLALTFWVMYRQHRYLKFSLLMILLLFGLRIFYNYEAHSDNIFTVYNLRNAPAYQFVGGKTNILLTDSSLTQKNLDFAISGNLLATRRLDVKRFQVEENIQTDLLKKQNGDLQFSSLKIKIISDKEQVNYVTEQPLSIDYLILSRNPYLSIDEISSVYRAETLIFDASNTGKRISEWKEQCKSLKINYFSVPDSGAFVVKCKP